MGLDPPRDLSGIPHDNVLYVGKHGNDANDGKNPDRAFLTFAAAIAAASADTPSASNRFVIVCQDAGIYDETPALASYISLHAPDATISRLWLYDQCYVTIGRIVATAASVWGIGSGTAYLRARYIETPGTAGGSDAITVVTGQALHLILDVDEMSVGSVGDGIVVDGGSVTGRVGRIKVEDGSAIWPTAASTFVNLTVGEIEITGTGMGVNSGSNGNVQVTVGRIFDAGAGKALFVSTKARVSVGSISCGIAYSVGASGELYMFVSELSGTETVAAGGRAEVTRAGSFSHLDYVVGPVGQARFQTIQAAIDQAVTDGHGAGNEAMVYILDGTYTEDLTLKDGIWLRAVELGERVASVPTSGGVNVVIEGNHTLVSGEVRAWGMRFEGGAGSSTFTYSGGAGNKRIQLYGCYVNSVSGQSLLTFATGMPEYLTCYECYLSSNAAAIFTGGTFPVVQLNDCFAIRSGGAGDIFVLTGGALACIGGRNGDASRIQGRIHVSSGAPSLTIQCYVLDAAAEHVQADVAVAGGSFFEHCVDQDGDAITIAGAQASTFKERPLAAVAGDIWKYDGNQFKLAGQNKTLNFVIDGGGSAITTGIKGDFIVDFAGEIQSVTLLADQSGSIVVDIWKDTYANFPPLVGDSITSGAKPTISGSNKSQDSTLTGWTKDFVAGDIFRVNVDSVATLERVTLSLKVRRK